MVQSSIDFISPSSAHAPTNCSHRHCQYNFTSMSLILSNQLTQSYFTQPNLTSYNIQQFPIIEFEPETLRILLDYLHTGSCPLTCTSIPGLICAAEHYDLPELLQACFHHAKQFLRIEVVGEKMCCKSM